MEPGQALSASNAYVPLLYDLALVISPEKNTFGGQLTIALTKNDTCQHPSTDAFKVVLNSSKLVFTSAVVKPQGSDNEAVKLKIFYSKELEQVTFSSHDHHPALADAYELKLEYVGQINTIKTYSDATFGLFKTNYLDPIGGKSANYIFATHNQPCFTRRIFPLVDEVGFKVPIKLTVTTLNRFKVVSNAIQLSKELVSMSDLATFAFKTTPPMSAHLFAIVLGDMESRSTTTETQTETETEPEKVPITFYTPIGQAASAAYPLEVASKVLPFISDTILQGVAYPLEKLDLVALPFLSDMVMENWGVVTFHLEQVLHNSSEQQIRQLVAHELVHQWVGNYVSFDSWKWMWLNESFATWLGNYILSELRLADTDADLFVVNSTNEKHTLMSAEDSGNDVSISIFTHNVAKHTLNSSLDTGVLFNKDVYDKGICLLNVLASVLGYPAMLEGVQKFIAAHKLTAVSADRLWECLGRQTDTDLVQIVQSFMDSTSYPVVYVGFDASKQLVAKLEPQGHENVPIFARTSTETVPIVSGNKSSIKLPADLVCLTSVGYYQVKYSLDVLPAMKANFSQILAADLISIFTDYGKYLSLASNTHLEDLVVFVSLLNNLASDAWKVDFNVLKVALSHLESVNNILAHHSEYVEFEKWVHNFTQRLFVKIGNWDLQLRPESSYSHVEMSARNLLLLLNISNSDFQAVAKKYFKDLMNSGISKTFTPKELIPSIFTLTIVQANQKEYKQVLNFVKNSNLSVLDHTDCTVEAFQTAAVTSLGFTVNNDLLNKTLNFVLMNIDSKLIELALIGFYYKPSKEMKLKLFQWYTVNYNTLVLRSLTKNSSWGVQLQSTLENITKMILGDLMVFDKELIKMKAEFVAKATKLLPAHGIVDILNHHQNEIDYKNIIGSYYVDLVPYLHNK